MAQEVFDGRQEKMRLGALLLVAAIVRIPTFGQPITVHHGWRQTQTALTIRNFSRFGIDLLHPEVPIFGRRSVVVYELPLFQAVASQLTRFGLSAETSGRLVALASLLTVGALAVLIARRLVGARWSLLAGAAVLFSPFSLFWGSAVMIEYLAVALVLGAVLAVFRWNETHQHRWLAIASCCGCVGAAVKFSTVLPWVLAIVAVLSTGSSSRARRLVWSAIVVLPATVAGLAWTLWADSLKQSSARTRELATGGMIRSSIQSLPQVGTWDFLRMPVRTIVVQHYGWIGLIALLATVVTLFDAATGRRRFVVALVTMPVIAVVLFPIQYKVHDYYTAALAPSFAFIMAIGTRQLALRSPTRVTSSRGAIGVLATLVVMAASLDSAERAYAADRFAKVRAFDERAEQIRRAAPAGSVVGVIQNSWNPTLSYLLDRDTEVVWSADSMTAADWIGHGVRTIAVGFASNETLQLIKAPWIESSSPVLMTVGPNAGSMRSFPTITSTTSDLAVPDGAVVVECDDRGTNIATPRSTFVVRPVQPNPTALVQFGATAPIPMQRNAVVRPTTQSADARLVCPVGPLRLLIEATDPIRTP